MMYPCEFDQNPSIDSGDGVQISMFRHSNVSCDLDNMDQGRQNLITPFPCPNNVSVQVW